MRHPLPPACRFVFRAVLLAACLSAVASLAVAATPNIVLITADDINWRDYGYTGTSSATDVNGNFVIGPLTPAIDTLFTNGVTYNMGHCPVGLCRPSLNAIFTGLNPVQNGVYGNDPSVNGVSQGGGDHQWNNMMRRNVEQNPTLPRMLVEQAGYLALQTGKWWEGDPKRGGFTNAEPGFATTNADRHLHSPEAQSIGRGENTVTTRIGQFVDEAVAAAKPFFVSYAPMLPHTPYNPPSNYLTRYQSYVSATPAAGKISQNQANYLAMVDWFDATIAELRALMQTKGVDDNTLYVYAADNGWLVDANRNKRTPFEDGVRNPLIFYQPGTITDGRSVAEKVADTRLGSSTDIMPTLLSLTGAPVPETLQGVDLLAPTAQRQRMFGDSYQHDQKVMDSNQYTIGNPELTRTSYWMIEDSYKLIKVTAHLPEQNLGPAVQLYNLVTDPGEKTNLTGDPSQASRLASMSNTLDQWWINTRPTYLYDHEFNGDTSAINGAAPDVKHASAPSAAWSATAGVLKNGTISGGSTGELGFAPVAGKRYELRSDLNLSANTVDGMTLGYLKTGAPSGDMSDDGLGWLRLSGNPSGNVSLDLYARADGGVASTSAYQMQMPAANLYALTLVLDTRDNDPSRAGTQWALDMLVNGVSKHKHVYTDGNPSIANFGLGGMGSGTQGTVDYLQLVETRLYTGTEGGQAETLNAIYSDTFNRANSNDLGTNDNGLGGTISAPWVSKEYAATDHKIQDNKFHLTNNGPDSLINHNFTAAELGKKFSVTFDVSLGPSANDWAGILLGVQDDETIFFTPPTTTVNRSDVPLGIIFKADQKCVTWDNGTNGGGNAAMTIPLEGMKVKLEVDSPDGYDIGDAATLRLYTSTDGGATWTQFTNLRNQGLAEYAFNWTSGEMFMAIESMNSNDKTIDNLLISSNVPGQWQGPGGGAWGDLANWTAIVPGGNTGIANLWRNLTSPGDVDLESTDRTVKLLSFDNPSAAYTIMTSGAGVLHMAADSGNASITVQSGAHTVTAPVSLDSNTDVTLVGGALSLNGATGGAGALALKTGSAGTLRIGGNNYASGYSGGTTVEAGTLQLDVANALKEGSALTISNAAKVVLGGATTSNLGNAVKIGDLTINGDATTGLTATVDLNMSKVIVDKTGSSVATVRAQIKSAYAGGTWTGNGITSSTAAAQRVISGPTAKNGVGYLDNAILASQGGSKTTWQGRSVNSNSILVRYTYYGDANLDGAVNLADFGLIKANYGTGSHWYQGDFDYSGTVNLADFGKLKASYGLTPITADAVPEPSIVALLLTGGLAAGVRLLRRRPSRNPSALSQLHFGIPS